MEDTTALRVGVDLGGTKIQSVIVNADNEVLGQDRRPTPTEGGPPDVADAIAESVRTSAADAKISIDNIIGVGVGSPGLINAAEGTVSQAGNLPNWMFTYALGPELTAWLAMPSRIANDVQVAVTAEHQLGAGRPYSSLIGIFVGTGVGGGVIINNELWLGRGYAGEIGHMCIQEDGAPCTCGRRGCMEAYAGGAAMELQARRLTMSGQTTNLFEIMGKKGRPRLSSGVWSKAAKRDDPMALMLLERAIWAVGMAAANAVNLLDVEAAIIGGGLGCGLGQTFVDRIEESMLPHLLAREERPAILLAALGDLGGALGAALLVEDLDALPVQRRNAKVAAKAKAKALNKPAVSLKKSRAAGRKATK